ncbi:response regulator [Archangium sp.]|jgi:CheY-like chemotaxis protein|uniref:response regulator n=1 Tax=Archangium sp. TaxID=1872627 RepID=UPI002ED9A28A
MKVLLVEDDASLREGMSELISELAEVREAGSVPQALAALREGLFDLVISDLRIGENADGGRRILEAARGRLQPVAIVSAAAAEEVVRALRPFEPDAVLAKPFQIDDVLGLVTSFKSVRDAVGKLARESCPPATAEGWTELAGGVRMLERQPGQHAWLRMAPGSTFSWKVQREPVAVMLLEGDLEVDGERRAGQQYLFLAAGPREAKSQEGCLAVWVAGPVRPGQA